MFDTEKRKVIVSRQLTVPDGLCQAVSQVQYSLTGYYLACGMYTGAVWLMDPLTLSPWSGMPLTHCSHSITNMAFSPHCDYLAVADTSQCVTLYGIQPPRVYLVGQCQAHNKPIMEIRFETREGELNLFSLAADLTLVCFHVDDNGLKMKFIHRVEQSSIPRCILPFPGSDNLWLMVSSDMKFKLLDSETLKCCKTLQAPNLGCSINFIKLLPDVEGSYLVFGTDHHLGLLILPLDGNPHKAVAVRSSPTNMISCKLLSDGKHIFTISENCSAVNMWRVNTLCLEKSYRIETTGLAPYWDLLEGGSGREQQLREIFLVGQFMHLGEKSGAFKSLTNYLPVCEVVNTCRALGFFPSKHQIDNIMYELRDKKYLTFEQFVQLFANHQSSRALLYEDLLKAFRDFYDSVYYFDRDPNLHQLTSNPIFDSTSFIEHIMTSGEGMSHSELELALSILLGSRTSFSEDSDLNSLLPKELSFKTFIKDLLGFPFEETFTQSCCSPSPESQCSSVCGNSIVLEH